MDKSQSDLEKLEQRIQKYDLDEFCKWVKDHHAMIEYIGPYGITASDGTLNYPYEPKGGLSISYWPQLKNICGPEDDDNTEYNRNQIIGAMLEKILHAKYSDFLTGKVVYELKQYCKNNGYLFWTLIDNNPDEYDDIVAYLSARAEEIKKEMFEEEEEKARLARQQAVEKEKFQKHEEEACLARQKAEEEENRQKHEEQARLAYQQSLNTFLSLMKITIPSSIPSDNVKVIDTVKIGFGHESFWLDFGENDMVTLEKEEIFLFQCFVVRVLVGSQSEIVLHSELNEAISESTPESLTASEKLRNKISSLNRQFNEKGKPPDRKQWIRSDKGKGYYLNKTVKWDADEDTIRNRKTNSAYIQLVLPSDVIDNWKKGKEGDD